MMNVKFIFFYVILAVGMISFLSCEKEDNEVRLEGYARGVFISCEGTFNANNGSVSWFDPDSGIVINYLFEKVNGRPAGDVVQSVAVAGELAVIVANNSQKIEVVNIETFESVSTITGFSYPRFFTYSGNGSGYLSNGNLQGHVYRVELESGTITDTIEVGMGPEQMVIVNNYLYVANSGGWAFDNTVSVVDLNTNNVTATIGTGDVPVAMVADSYNNVWVLSRGKVVYNDTWTEIIEETDSRLVRINTQTGEADRDIVIGKTGDGFNPSWLSASPDGNTLYYGESEGIYAIDINDQQQPSEPLIEGSFSSAAPDPATGLVLALEVTDYSSPGKLHIFDGNTLEETYDTGIAPGGFAFPVR